MRYSRLAWISTMWATVASASASPPALCPAGLGALGGDAPSLSVEVAPGKSLIVCGHTERYTPPVHLSEFDVWATGYAPQPRHLFVATANEEFEVTPRYESRELQLDRVIYLPEKNPLSGADELRRTPLVRTQIRCDARACHPTKPACVLDLKAFRTSYSELLGRTDLDLEEPGSYVVEKLTLLALRGNARAEKALRTAKADGHVAEERAEALQLIRAAHLLHCPKN